MATKCPLEGVEINYKDTELLKKYISKFGKIVPRYYTGVSLKKQKQHLCELLNKNQLYVNLSSLNDENFECTAEEKNLNRDFYKI